MSGGSYMRRLIWILAVFSTRLPADVTVTMKMEFKTSVPLPPQVSGQMQAQSPGNMVMRVKGTRCYTEMSNMIYIGDSGKKEIIVLDPAGKRYAQAAVDQYMKAVQEAMPDMPANAQMPAIHADGATRLTGRTATIQGILAEERELVFTMDAPGGLPAAEGPLMRMVLQMWSARPEEQARVPALREMKAYSQWAAGELNPAAAMSKSLGRMPGMGESLGKLMSEFTGNGSMVMRVHGEIFMPGLAAMLKNLPEGANPLGGDISPDAPMMEMNQEVSEISTAPVPDSSFAIPVDYQKVELTEILRSVIGRTQAPTRPRQ